MTLTAGSRLGPYEILSPLGAGGMGEVYRARDTRLERTVAIKVLPTHLSSTLEARQRFEREAKTISQLSHPHICALHDVGREGETEYLVMEYLEGDTLADRVAKGPLPLEQTLRYGVQIADALDKAHRQGIVHRDLKPGNVMITKSGVKLLDFGLAKAIAPASQQSSLTALPTQHALTQEGAILGTFQYMAPEQLEGKDADARTDIFALGAVLYEMATGKKAFSGTTQASLISSILRDDPQPISQIQPTSPTAFDRVVKTCVAKDPEDRWQSAADLGKELRWIAEGSQVGAPAALPGRRVRRDRLAWSVAGLLLLAAIFLAIEVRRLGRGSASQAVHSFLVPPEKTSFRLTGDDSAPIVLSPDGRSTAFGAGGKLWVGSLAAGAVRALVGTEGGTFPFWSPDNRFIGFFSEGKLRIVETSGGPVRTIADAPNARGGAWSPRGVIVFAPDFRLGLFRVTVSGGPAVPLTRIEEGKHTTHRWPSFLPDGTHVLFLAANHANPRSEDSGIYVASLDGGTPRRLMSSYGSAQYVSGWLLSVRDTSLMAFPFDARRLAVKDEPVRVADDANFDFGVWRGSFTASENGMLAYQIAQAGIGGQLTWCDSSGRRLSTVGEKSEAYSPQLSPDGRRALVILGDPNNDIWVYELERGVRTRLTTAAQVTVSPLWSPDGSQILYVSQERPRAPLEFLMMTMPSDGGGDRKILYRSKERIEPMDWSRDGRYVLVDRGDIGKHDVWVIPVAEPARAFPLVQTQFSEAAGQISPDGRWVAYQSLQTARNEVYVTAFPSGGARWQVSGRGGTQPRWSHDGRELYFVSADDDFMVAEVDAGGSRFEVKDVRPLFRVNLYRGPRVGLHSYAVAADGKRFLLNDAGEASVPRVALVTNWTAGLKK
ncbi:MAG TPA: protein kinase [Thermoanaerobaculia bacterium]|nr:protein kinase [Thermoanaerobaculia bacterium]